jgi:hypothetical protein
MAVFQSTPTITVGAYSANDIIGGVITIRQAGANNNLLVHLGIFDDDGQKVRIDFLFFDDELTGTYTDNAALTLDAADKSKLRGVAPVYATDYFDVGADAMATANVQLSLFLIDRTIENLFVIALVRGTPTYTTTSSLRFEFGFLDKGI